jgi:hypothetical protein
MPLEQRSQLTDPESGLERFVLAQFCFQLACCNLCRLQRSRQRTRYDQIRPHLQTVKKLGYLSHLFLAEISERPLIIWPGPVWPIGFAVSEKTELHGNKG